MAAAKSTGLPVVVGSATTESRLVRANPVGSFTAEVTPGPVRVKGGDGSWRDVDTTLVAASDGSVSPRVVTTPMRFSGGGSGDLAQIRDGAATLSMSWPSQLPSAEVRDDTVTYPEVYPGVDLVAKAGADGFGTYLVVKTAAAATDSRVRQIRYSLRGSGLSMKTSGADALTVVDGSGKARFDVGKAFMWDSAGVRSAADLKSHVAVDRATDDVMSTAKVQVAATEVTLTPDLSMLDDPDTVFPVVIDPAISASRGYTYWTSVASNGYRWVNSSTEKARVGYNGWESPTFKARSFYRFDTSLFSGKVIKSAKFAHKLIHSPNNSCTASTFGPGVKVYATSSGISSSTVWPGPGASAYSPTTNAKAHGNSSLCSGYDRLEWDVRSIVDAAGSTLTLGMRSADESDRDGWRKFDNNGSPLYPVLTVTYNSLPDKPGRPTLDGATGSYPSSLWTTDSTPTLRAKVTDPDGSGGGQVKGLFEIYAGSTKVTSGYGSWVSSGGTSVWTVPSGRLSQNTLYTVRVYGQDYADRSSTWSDYIQFRGDWTPPATPSISEPGDVAAAPMSTVTVVVSGPADAAQFCFGVRTDVTTDCRTAATPTVGSEFTVGAGKLTSAGDAWVTVAAKDQAGTLSTNRATVYFRVTMNGPNHRWKLDGSGTDEVGDVDVMPTSGTQYVFGTNNPAADGTNEDNGNLGLHFASTSHAAVANGPAVPSGQASFTVAAWVRYGGSSLIAPAAVTQNGDTAAAFHLGARNNQPSFVIKTTDGVPGTNVVQLVRFCRTLPDGQWRLLVGMYSAPDHTAQLCVFDPVEDKLCSEVVTLTGPAFAATGPLIIGRGIYNGVPADFWTGDVDDVWTFPGVIDESTLSQIYFEGL